ncbi:MAG TPA: MerR family transcriptional regulator, partial [Polyangiaceae bacterium]|nr:MerR family transcriptional regulator [Polyangiaceae bacterium]
MPSPLGRPGRGARRGKRKAPGAIGEGPFRIRVAAELSGVPAATLRAWERRYGVPAPSRTTSAYRLYSANDVEQVRRLRVLVERGVSPAEAARAVLAEPAPAGRPPPPPAAAPAP